MEIAIGGLGGFGAWEARRGSARLYALRQRAILTARHALDVGLFADRLSQVLHREVPAHVVGDVEAGRPVDWEAMGGDALDLYL